MQKEDGMSKNRSSISNAESYRAIGEYWDRHDLSEVWDDTQAVDLEVGAISQRHFFPLEQALSNKVHRLARTQGVSAETLLNLWVQEQVAKAGL